MESFIFYETFEEQLSDLDDATAIKFYKAISSYGLYDKDPCFTGLERAVWIPIKTAIDSAKSRRTQNQENGKKGGRPVKIKPNKTEKNPTKPTTNLNVNGNGNGNVYDNVNANGGGGKSSIVDLSDISSINDKPVKTTTTTDSLKNIKDWLKKNELFFDSKDIASLSVSATEKGKPLLWLEYVLDSVKSRYPKKTTAEIRLIFKSACTDWDDLTPGFLPWIKKHERKKKKLANKVVENGTVYNVCKHCGAHVNTALAICPKCYEDMVEG